MRGKFAFSLVELMVTVGIVGIIATLATPRYKSFIASARRGEAKAQLHTIHTLQETYRAEHGTYHSGLVIGYFKEGRKVRCEDDDNTGVEMDNRLGFRPKNCDKLRYGYTTSGGDGRAFAPSDAHQRWVYPDCNGCGDPECGEDQGDLIAIYAARGNPTVCRNITKYCPRDGVCATTPPIIPPIITTSTPNWSCDCVEDPGATWDLATGVNPSNVCACKNYTEEKTSTFTCTLTGTPPPGTPCSKPDNTVYRSKPGLKPISSCTTNECPCVLLSDPRCPAVCDTISDTQTNWKPDDLSDKYTCVEVTQKKTRTVDLEPPLSDPTLVCDDIVSTEKKTICGTKTVTCANSCTWTPGDWETCGRNTSENNPAAADYCVQLATDNKTCKNPCLGLISSICSTPTLSCLPNTRSRTKNCTSCKTVCACDCRWTLGTEETSDQAAYTCKKSQLQRIDDFTCARGPPGCVLGAPCQSPTTRSEGYSVDGSKLIDASTPIDDDCPCGVATPDPRSACNDCTCTTTSTTPSCSTPATDLSTVYPCIPVEEQTPYNKTIACTSSAVPPDQACVNKSSNTSANLTCKYTGTKLITCDNICEEWGDWGDWGECELRSSGKKEKWRTRNRQCPNPCPDRNITDTHGNLVGPCNTAELESDSDCDKVPEICGPDSHTDLKGKTVVNAASYCKGTMGGTFSKMQDDDPSTANSIEYICRCPTACSDCPPGWVRNTCTVDECDCVNPNAALNCCYLTNLQLGMVLKFVQGGDSGNNECAPLLGTKYASQISALQMVDGNYGQGADHQKIWEVFVNVAIWGDEGAACHTALIEDILSRNEHHILRDISAYEHLFIATKCCSNSYGAVYDNTKAPGCP